MRVSCLCVTENRPDFMAWLLWNYEKQTWPERELIVVDSSVNAVELDGDGVRWIRMRPGATVAEKRNRAMQEASGEVITWFDDDDWQHPDKCEILVNELLTPLHFSVPSYVGSQRGWFVRLRDLACRRYEGSAIVLLPTFGGWRNCMVEIPFMDGPMAPDTWWLWQVRVEEGRVLEREDLSFWLCHDGNTYNRPERWEFDEELEALRAVIGEEAWGDTDAALADLRGRLGYE